ncbi:hypothetical protein CPC08DRAFT_737152 [Agrocybe pediades]|nr:hypothetical protein CPC08DRAFT_737152 [Agrocybe pediades]
MCQAAYFNLIDDFCIWGPSEPESGVANTEGEMVAWCSKPGHGTRLITQGALTGLQWIQTPDYVQAIGFIDQVSRRLGGEMDPHNADLRGNPMGGLVYSSAFNGMKQVVARFCFKACDPAGPNAPHYCEHVFYRNGCDYIIPNAAKDGVVEHCKGMLFYSNYLH